VHQSIGLYLISTLAPRAPAVLVLTGVCGAMLVLAWLIHRFVERPLAPHLKRGLRPVRPAAETDHTALAWAATMRQP
jgi:peptidoglycan/LPS O-acetylase OafA/YrhL